MIVFLAVLIPATGTFGEEEIPGEEQFMKHVRQLTFEGARAGEGYFSPDGNFLIFQSEREPGNPFFQIYILSFEDGETHRVSPGVGKTTCAFFRPGTNEVLYASTHLDPEAATKQEEEIEFRKSGKKRHGAWDYDSQYDIFRAQRDGSGLERLTDAEGYDAEAAYSPDGGKIVFCSLRDAYPVEDLSADEQKQLESDPSYFGEIYIMNADGSNQKRLTDWPGYDGGSFFSPDGERIIWRHFNEEGALADVYTMRLDGSDRRRLTEFKSMSWAPYLHPSGQYAIFTSNKLGFSNFELFMVDAMGTKEPVQVSFTDGFDGLPVFSPDGNKLAWTTNRTHNNKSQIYIGKWDHQAALGALKESPERQPAEAKNTDTSSQAPYMTPDRSSHESSSDDERGLSPRISADDLREEVGYLASDELEGRLTGSKGAKKAAKYIEKYFKNIGLEPLGDEGKYFQGFPFTSGVKIDKGNNSLAVEFTSKGAKRKFKVDEQFRPLAFTENGEVEGEVVFAGYGLKVPGAGEEGYDSYADIDVKDKIVLVLRFVPEDVDMDRRQELNVYAGLRYKAMVARENGAKALLVATGPNSPSAGELIPLKFDQSLASSGICVASVTSEVTGVLFDGSGKTLAEIQTELDTENLHAQGAFPLEGVKVEFSTAVKREKKKGRNVIGYLPPADSVEDPEYIVVGAHYDHIGHGDIGSLARKGEEGQIHNGADDNASGTATVLELAAALAEARKTNPDDFNYGLVFALWSGEELGIIGSNFFAKNPTVPIEKVAAYINFDMVGRLKDNKLMLQGIGSSNAWAKLIEKRNVVAGFDLKLQSDPYLPTDVTAFYPKKIPVMSFFTGAHEDYNRPTDDPETLHYEDMVRIAKFAKSILVDMQKKPERPDYIEVARSSEKSGQRSSMRAYLGTVPDFSSSDVEGVKLSGVRADGPADRAGIQEGDIIVEFAGKEIKNLYDYSFVLGAVKIGEPTEIVVLRGSERVTLTITPEVRK
jgi:Tol biopolymer transport system component